MQSLFVAAWTQCFGVYLLKVQWIHWFGGDIEKQERCKQQHWPNKNATAVWIRMCFLYSFFAITEAMPHGFDNFYVCDRCKWKSKKIFTCTCTCIWTCVKNYIWFRAVWIWFGVRIEICSHGFRYCKVYIYIYVCIEGFLRTYIMPARYICILIRSGFPELDFWSPVCFQNRPLHSTGIYYNGPIGSSSISIQITLFKFIFIITSPCQTLFLCSFTRSFYMGPPVKDSTPSFWSLFPPYVLNPQHLEMHSPIEVSEYWFSNVFPISLFERIPVSCGDWYINAP